MQNGYYEGGQTPTLTLPEYNASSTPPPLAHMVINQGGKYEVQATADFSTTDTLNVSVGCTLTDGSGPAYDYSEATIPAPGGNEALSLMISDTFTTGEAVNLTCWWGGSGTPTVYLATAAISAIQASSISTATLSIG